MVLLNGAIGKEYKIKRNKFRTCCKKRLQMLGLTKGTNIEVLNNKKWLSKDVSIMGKGRRYDQDYKDMIVDLFKSGMSVSEISSEYGIAKSTINGWIKDVKRN